MSTLSKDAMTLREQVKQLQRKLRSRERTAKACSDRAANLMIERDTLADALEYLQLKTQGLRDWISRIHHDASRGAVMPAEEVENQTFDLLAGSQQAINEAKAALQAAGRM